MKPSKSRSAEKVVFNMTPMIDCCFQLIIFFMLSLRLFTPEGDFSVKMPIAAPSEGPPPIDLPPIKITLKADSNGTLTRILMGDVPMKSFRDVHAQIRKFVGDEGGPGSIASKTEVELACDYQLKFEYVIQAITAVSGYVQDQKIIKLVEKIKFSSPSPPKRG